MDLCGICNGPWPGCHCKPHQVHHELPVVIWYANHLVNSLDRWQRTTRSDADMQLLIAARRLLADIKTREVQVK